MSRPRAAFALSLLLAFTTNAAGQYAPGSLPPEPPREPGVLDVSIAVFDPGIPEDESVHRDEQVYPRIREIESLFLPFVLRRSLHARDEFGVVRVVPEADAAAELLVTARIIESDGLVLRLAVNAVDAAGYVWLDQEFAASTVAAYASGDAPGTGYSGLYDEIAAALVAARAGIGIDSLDNRIELSLLRYAADLVPAAFEQYIGTRDDGLYTLLRLPAENDPMLERVLRLRRVEFAITDAIDERYEELHEEIAAVYDLWREYRRKFMQYQADEARRAVEEPPADDYPAGSYDSMMARYDRYKWDRMAVEEQDRWVTGFDNEVAPTIDYVEERIETLRGWVEGEYATWERILAEFYELENDFGD